MFTLKQTWAQSPLFKPATLRHFQAPWCIWQLDQDALLRMSLGIHVSSIQQAEMGSALSAARSY